jgi:hypothetical protein
VEQRYRAVLEVLQGGAPVTEVASRYGRARQTVVSAWPLCRRRPGRAGGPVLAADVVLASDARAGGGDRPAAGASGVGAVADPVGAGAGGVTPLPGRSAVYRALVRHGLVDPGKRKRRREDYRRWERGRAMQLRHQMDVMGRVHLTDGQEVKVVTGIDDHSCSSSTRRSWWPRRPGRCAWRWRRRCADGIRGQILTDNAKVFTARSGRRPGPVMFDRICADNGIRHLLTSPYSPTTTGKSFRMSSA